MEIHIDKKTLKEMPFKIKALERAKMASEINIPKPIIYDRFKKKAICMNCREEFSYSFGNGVEEIASCKARTVYIMNKFKSNDFIDCPLCKNKGRAHPHTSSFLVDTTDMVFWTEDKGEHIKSVITSVYYNYKPDIPWNEIKDIVATMLFYELVDLSRESQMAYLNYAPWRKCSKVYVEQSITQECVHIDDTSLRNSLKRSFLKYNEKDILNHKVNGPNYIVQYMALCAKYPQIEYLNKNETLKQIVQDKLFGCTNHIRPNWRAKSVEGFLKLSSQDIDKLKNWAMFEKDEIAIYKNIKKYHKKVTKKQVVLVHDVLSKTYNKLGWIIRRDAYAVCKYLLKTFEENKPECSHGAYGYSLLAVAGTYKDYVEHLKLLEYPETDYYLYPPKMMQAHDRVAKEYNIVLDKKKKEEVAKIQKKFEKRLNLLKQFIWSNDTYLIRPLEDSTDFANEGRNNHNCVAGYYQRAAEGKCTVFVVRKKDAPDESFCTLEVTNDLKSIRQLYAKGNTTAPDEVHHMVQWWLEDICKKKASKTSCKSEKQPKRVA